MPVDGVFGMDGDDEGRCVIRSALQSLTRPPAEWRPATEKLKQTNLMADGCRRHTQLFRRRLEAHVPGRWLEGAQFG
jgi:hypothetical protein